MSHIHPKGPRKIPTNFEALNGRKNQKTVGQTYGERRGNEASKAGETSTGWIQSIKDRFLGRKKPNNIGMFANKNDSYQGPNSRSAQSVIERKRELESGYHLKSRVAHPPKDQYVSFLDQIITSLNSQKTQKKV